MTVFRHHAGPDIVSGGRKVEHGLDRVLAYEMGPVGANLKPVLYYFKPLKFG